MKEKNIIPALVFILLTIQEEKTIEALEYAKRARKNPEVLREIKKLKAIDKNFRRQCLEALRFHSTCLN